MVPIGTFLHQDNLTRCATRMDGARLCIEVDAAKTPLTHFWIGAPGLPTSKKQEVVYKTLPTYCATCKMQGHNSRMCRTGKSMKNGQFWVGKKGHQEVAKYIEEPGA